MKDTAKFTRRQAGRLAIGIGALGAGAFGLSGCGVQGLGGLDAAGGPRIDPGSPVAVGLLVPSGSGQASDAILAAGLENAARLAIADLLSDPTVDVRIDLRVYQTAGRAEEAATAARRAVDEGAVILLGPVYAREAASAGAAVSGRGITVLSFSNSPEVAGGNVVVLGNTFANSANRLIGHLARTAVYPVGIVHDRTPQGEAGRDAIIAAANRSGVQVLSVDAYSFSQEGVAREVPEIGRNALASGVRALVLTADAAGALPLVSQYLRDAGLNDPARVRLVGITRWDVPRQTLSLPGLAGGWFAGPDPETRNAFDARYAQAHGQSPHPIAGLAYDAVAAIGALVRTRRAVALQRASLGQSAGFAGVNGIFRILPDGTTERGLAVMEVAAGSANVIDPSPLRFAAPGV
jgi:hypothetical protein